MNESQRADKARAILESDIVTEARIHMRDKLTQAAWRRHELTPADQLKLDALMRHFGDFFAFFERAVADGKHAEAELAQKSRLRRASERLLERI